MVFVMYRRQGTLRAGGALAALLAVTSVLACGSGKHVGAVRICDSTPCDAGGSEAATIDSAEPEASAETEPDGGAPAESYVGVEAGPDRPVVLAQEGGVEAGADVAATCTDMSRADAGATFVCGQVVPNMTTEFGAAIVGDSQGDVYVASALLPSSGSPYDSVLRKYDAACALVWQKSIAVMPAADVEILALALDSSGNLFVYGQARGGSVTFGGSVLGGLFLAKLSPAGAHIWSKQFSGEVARAMAVDAAGNIAITGMFMNSIDFGGGALARPANACAFTDAFLAKLDTNGNHIFSKRYEATNCICGNTSPTGNCLVDPLGVDIGPTGEVAFAAQLVGSIDLGGGTASATKGKALVGKLGSDGTYLSSGAWGSDIPGEAAWRVRFDSRGELFVLGRAPVNSSFDFGSGVTASGSIGDLSWLVKFDTNLNAQWGRTPSPVANSGGGAPTTTQGGLAVDGCGNSIVLGTLYNSVDFGDGPVAAPVAGAFFAGYDPRGSFAYKRVIEFSGDSDSVGTAAPTGGALLVGTLRGTADFGGGQWTAANSNGNLYFVRYAP